MTDEAVIREALIRVYDEECRMAEQEAELSGPHAFSDRFIDRMKKISGMARRQYVTVMHIRVRLALVVAALIAVMVAATVTTIAIVRPQIFYTVRKGLKSWDYTFRQEDPNKLAGGFEYKTPLIPEGFELVVENRQSNSYVLYYENGDYYINYEQEKLDSDLKMSLTDSFTSEESIKVNGYEATLFTEDDMHYVLWNDGYYVYFLGGNCTRKEVMQMAETIG